SLRVPLLLAGPGIEAGRVLDPLSLHADLLPTLLGLAGAPAPPGVQGHDLGPLLTAPERAAGPREVVHAAYVDRARMASDGEHKLIRHLRPFRRDELYALATDPGETEDVASDAALAPIRDRLAASLVAWQQAAGEPGAEESWARRSCGKLARRSCARPGLTVPSAGMLRRGGCPPRWERRGRAGWRWTRRPSPRTGACTPSAPR